MWDAHEERMKGIPLNGGGTTEPKDDKTIWSALPGFTFGTPDLVAVRKNEFVLTYYATVNGVLHVRGCRFRLLD